jgi:hypothetical protein
MDAIGRAEYVPIHRFDLAEKLATMTIQGLANRSGPRIFTNSRFWNWPPADEHWREYFENTKGAQFEEVGDLKALVTRHRDLIGGAVLYDPEVLESLAVAMTLAGLRGLLPLTEALAKDFPDLPVADDLRGRWSSEPEALRWALGALLPECQRGKAYSIDQLWSGPSIDSLDYAVMQKMFVYHVDLRSDDREWGQAKEAVQRSVGPDCGIYGWGEPEEQYCGIATRHNNYIMCSEAPNLSFHAQVPAPQRETYRQTSQFDAATAKVEPRHYIAFMTSEGDAMKIHSVFHGGSWLNEGRGTVAINWGFQPRMIDQFPHLIEYYYASATPRDYFVLGASGAGFIYPNQMPEPDPFFRATGELMRRTDTHVIECWLHFARPAYERYAELSGALGFTLPGGPRPYTILGTGAPAMGRHGRLNYFNAKGTPQDMADAIKEVTADQVAPSFETVFFVPDVGDPAAQGGYSAAALAEVERLLGSDYKVCTLAEMMWAFKETQRR